MKILIFKSVLNVGLAVNIFQGFLFLSFKNFFKIDKLQP